jgi:hypothetical protein
MQKKNERCVKPKAHQLVNRGVWEDRIIQPENGQTGKSGEKVAERYNCSLIECFYTKK